MDLGNLSLDRNSIISASRLSTNIIIKDFLLSALAFDLGYASNVEAIAHCSRKIFNIKGATFYLGNNGIVISTARMDRALPRARQAQRKRRILALDA